MSCWLCCLARLHGHLFKGRMRIANGIYVLVGLGVLSTLLDKALVMKALLTDPGNITRSALFRKPVAQYTMNILTIMNMNILYLSFSCARAFTQL